MAIAKSNTRDTTESEAGAAIDATTGPVHWPTLTADEAAHEWTTLLAWVNDFVMRYPNGPRIPDCWWQHRDIVEALSALRDYERASFSPRSPATAAVEWQRARRDIEHAIEQWVRRLPCAVPGRGHRPTEERPTTPAGWNDHLRDDLEQRRVADSEADASVAHED